MKAALITNEKPAMRNDWPPEDFQWAITIEVRKLYKTPPLSTAEAIRRDKEEAALGVYAMTMAKKFEEHLDKETL